MNKNDVCKIGNLIIEKPIFQGGMGVGVSLSSLAGAVAREGGVGVISTAQIGFRDPDFSKHPIECNLRAMETELEKAKKIAREGVIGVNIMTVTRGYEEYVKTAIKAGADLIISGAGLPMNLPKLVEGSDVKIVPIVSTQKALYVLSKYWRKKYNRLPDAVIIEGPMAGGHLGFSREEIEILTPEVYDREIVSIINFIKTLEQKDIHIPVIVAGGVFEKKDMEHYIQLGADGVQLATRFVTTKECDAHENYKKAYLAARKEDIVIVKSPVGMPGRAIHNAFLDKVAAGERFMRGCKRCIQTCDVKTAPYCITEALINAVEGRVDEGLIFCGSNAYRCNKIETVKEIMEEFVS